MQNKLPLVVSCIVAAGFDTQEVISSMDTSENPGNISQSFNHSLISTILVIETSIQVLPCLQDNNLFFHLVIITEFLILFLK